MIFELLWLFLIYSFVGWVMETSAAAIRHHHFMNKGIINEPYCVIYGFGGLVVTLFGQELHGVWLFVGCFIVTTVVEWIAGHLIERWYHQRWWDYSKLKWNLDGYISLQTSCIWAALGFIVVEWGNSFLLSAYHLLPALLMQIVVLVLTGLLATDALATLLVLSKKSKNQKRWEETDESFASVTKRLSARIYHLVDKRIRKAYPQRVEVEEEERNPAVFADGCGFYKIVMLFFIGAFLGDLTETLFCRVTAGVWMSRSSVVWGPFSIVWGLAISAVTVLLYKYRKSSDSFLFLLGMFLGGAYEYVCSVFTELVFGTVFWDYSWMPFNLGGRINLLYCFFWGFAAVVWLKKLYPLLSGLIEKIPVKVGKILTWLLLVFMTVNVAVSGGALIRYDERSENIAADNAVEEWLDDHFDDQRMEKIYPNAKKVE